MPGQMVYKDNAAYNYRGLDYITYSNWFYLITLPTGNMSQQMRSTGCDHTIVCQSYDRKTSNRKGNVTVDVNFII